MRWTIGWSLVLALTVGASWAEELDDAIALFEDGRPEDARALFQEAWKERPRPAAAYYLGRIDFSSGEMEAATEWFEQAVELDPRNADYTFWLGNGWGRQAREASIFRQLGLAKKCRTAYERAVELDPGHVRARESLVEYYLQAPGIAGGGDDKAETQARELMAIEPAPGHRLLARVYSDREMNAEALASYQKAVESDPSDRHSYYALGFHQQAQERWHGAFDAFEAALERFPGDPDALYQIGRTGVLSGQRLERARKTLLEYLALEDFEDTPGEAAARWRLGMVYEQLGNLANAVEQFEASVRLDADFPPARESLKSARRKVG